MLSTLSRHNLAISAAGQQCHSNRSTHQRRYASSTSCCNASFSSSSSSSSNDITNRSYLRQQSSPAATRTTPPATTPPTSPSCPSSKFTSLPPQSTPPRLQLRSTSSTCGGFDPSNSWRLPSAVATAAATAAAEPSWSEQLSRRWAVRFRSRRAVVRGSSSSPSSYKSNDDDDEAAAAAVTSRIHRLLLKQYKVCQSHDAETAERIVAVFFCWYLSRIEFVYGLLTASRSGAGRRSYVRLALAVAVVTALLLLAAFACVASLRLIWTGLTIVVQSSLNFALLLVCIFAVSIATVTFASFD